MKLPKKTPSFRGVTLKLPPGYDQTLQESVEQDLRDPEDANQPEVQNRIKRYGGSFNG